MLRHLRRPSPRRAPRRARALTSARGDAAAVIAARREDRRAATASPADRPRLVDVALFEPRAEQPRLGSRRAQRRRVRAADADARCGGKRRPCRAPAAPPRRPARNRFAARSSPEAGADRACACQTGKRISVRHSSDASAVVIAPAEEIGERDGALAGDGLRAATSASSASATRPISAAGSALARLPPIVPRLRVCAWPTKRSAFARSGSRRATVSSPARRPGASRALITTPSSVSPRCRAARRCD